MQQQGNRDWRTHHQGKRGTARYKDGVNAFCKHLAIHYRSKNFRNISDKHLASFVEEFKIGCITTEIFLLKNNN